MTRMAIYLARNIRLDGLQEFEDEKELIRREVRAIVDKTLEMGDGDVALGTVRAFEAGVLDIPWSPSRYCKSRVMPARDADGYLRIVDPADMPFPQATAITPAATCRLVALLNGASLRASWIESCEPYQ